MVFATLQVGPEARRIKTDMTVLIMDSKRRMIDALLSICKLRDDFRLRVIMDGFKKSVINGKALYAPGCTPETWLLTDAFHTAFNDVFTASGEIDGTVLNLDTLSKAPLFTICLDLMMYMQPELFEASMTLLKSCYTQRRSIVTAMDRVQVRAVRRRRQIKLFCYRFIHPLPPHLFTPSHPPAMSTMLTTHEMPSVRGGRPRRWTMRGRSQLFMTDDIPIFGTVSKLVDTVSDIKERIESYETWGVQASVEHSPRTAVLSF